MSITSADPKRTLYNRVNAAIARYVPSKAASVERSVGNTAFEQRSPDATSNPIRMSGEMANMAQRLIYGRARLAGALEVQPPHPTTVPSGAAAR